LLINHTYHLATEFVIELYDEVTQETLIVAPMKCTSKTVDGHKNVRHRKTRLDLITKKAACKMYM